MKAVSLTDVKAHLSALIRRVRRGEVVVILQRGQPVARLVPSVPEQDEAEEARLVRLEKAGLVRRGTKPVDLSLFDGPTPVRLSGKDSLSQALLQEREESM